MCRLFYVRAFLTSSIAMLRQDEWEFIDYISYEAKLKSLVNFANDRLLQLAETFNKQKEESKASSGYIDKVLVKVLDNLHVNMKNINIRLEDLTKPSCMYSLGVTLKELLVVNTDEKWEQKFIDRNVHKNINVFKLLNIKSFGLYLRCNDSVSFSSLFIEEIWDRMVKFFPFEANQAENVDYLIQPISLTVKLKQNNEVRIINSKKANVVGNEALMTVSINLDTFDIQILKGQFDYLIRLMNEVSNYQRFQFNFQYTSKFRFFRPKNKIKDAVTPICFDSKTVKNHNAVAWWQFAIRMIMKMLKYHQGHSNTFQIPQVTYKRYQKDFTELFYAHYKLNLDKDKVKEPDKESDKAKAKAKENDKDKDQAKAKKTTTAESDKTAQKAPPYNEKSLYEIIEYSDIKDLYEWTKPILQRIYQEKKTLNPAASTSFFQKKIDESKLIVPLTKEEQAKIDEILQTAINEEKTLIINNELETKLQIDFLLEQGSFKFYKAQKSSVTEGFAVNYHNLFFSIKNGEYFFELLSELKDLSIYMVTIINSNSISIPITFKELNENSFGMGLNTPMPKAEGSDALSKPAETFSFPSMADNFWTLIFRKHNPNNPINFTLSLRINGLNLAYHQVLFERILSFINVQVEEELANKAWDTLTNFKESTQQKIKANINKKNMINISIAPRKLIIPVNKYDIKNTKVLLVDLGKITLRTANNVNPALIRPDHYTEHYAISFDSFSVTYYRCFKDIIAKANSFSIVSNLSVDLHFAFLNSNEHKRTFPQVIMLTEINNFAVHLTEYLYTLLTFIVDIMKPTKEVDFWSQVNTNKDEIKANAKLIEKIKKKNNVYFTWEEHYMILSNGYLYFYWTLEDNDYVGYYYLKDSEMTVSSNELATVRLSNKYGSIELMFLDEERLQKWMLSVNERMLEMKLSANEEEDKTKDSQSGKSESDVVDPLAFLFGVHLILKRITVCLYKEDMGKLCTLAVNELFISAKIREYDYDIALGITGAYLVNEECTIRDYQEMLNSKASTDSKERLLDLKVLICDERSDKYANSQITVDLTFGYLRVIWNPIVIRKLLSYFVHNDITKHKVTREILIQNETLLEQNFLQPGKDEGLIRYKCNEHQYTLYKITANLKQVNVIWLQPILNVKFVQVLLRDTRLEAAIKVDHIELKGSLGIIEGYDLSQYPLIIEDNSFLSNESIRRLIIGTNKASDSPFITFEFLSMQCWCPQSKDDFVSEVKVLIDSPMLIYVHEHFLRCLNYFLSEFLGALTPSEEVKQFINEQYKLEPKKERDIDFMRIDLSIVNAEVLLKPRYAFNEHFIGRVKHAALSSYYHKVLGKIRATPEEYRWNSTYQFRIKGFSIQCEDNFGICAPINGIANIQICEFTDSDKLRFSILDFDYSYQFDLWINEAVINMRQKDFRNLMKCLDLNILYTDDNEKQYDFLKVKLPTVYGIDPNELQRQKVMDIYNDIILNVFLPKVVLRLHLDNTAQFTPFSEFIVQETVINFVKALSLLKTAQISMSDIEGYVVLDKKKEKILGDYSPYDTSHLFSDDYYSVISQGGIIPYPLLLSKESGSRGKVQALINVTIDSLLQKTMSIHMTGFKLLFSLNTIQLIAVFFIEGLPFYNKKDKDLPNQFDPNEENTPSLTVLLEIKKPLICFFTDSIENTQQDLISLSTEVIIGVKFEQISKIKTELSHRYITLSHRISEASSADTREALNKEILNDKGFIWSLNVSLFEICPFVVGMKDILGTDAAFTSSRKITDNFLVSYDDKTQVQFIPPLSYVISNVRKVNVNKIIVKASYKDIVLFLKMVDYYQSLLSAQYKESIDSLMQYSKDKANAEAIEDKEFLASVQSEPNQLVITGNNSSLNNNTSLNDKSFHLSGDTSRSLRHKEALIDKGIAMTTLMTQGIQIILIDDHANTFHPFISFYLTDFSLITESINKTQSLANMDLTLNAHSYNYIAGVWEPLIELTKFKVDITKDSSDDLLQSVVFHIKSLSLLNINISDLSVSFLTMTLSGWVDKYLKLKNSSNATLSRSEQHMKISNHTVLNYTGSPLVIHRLSHGKGNGSSQGLMQSNRSKQTLLSQIKPNEAYEIEYFTEDLNDEDELKTVMSNLINDNHISFQLNQGTVYNNTLKIDNIQSKIYRVVYDSGTMTKGGLFDYVISKVDFKKMKKFVYFYSPLCFKNKTELAFRFDLNAKKSKEQLEVKSKAMLGIPIDFIDGSIEIFLVDSNGGVTFPSKKYFLKQFLSDGIILEEISFSNVFINLFHPRTSSIRERIVKMCVSYSIRNCLPFDIQVILNEQKQMYSIPKSETVSISCLSIKKNLNVYLYFNSFSTKKEITLYNAKEPKHTVTIPLIDREGHKLEIYASLANEESTSLLLYASSAIVNHTGLALRFFYGKTDKKLVEIANQKDKNNFFLLNEEKYLVIQYQSYVSQKVSIAAIGTSSIIELFSEEEQNRIEFIMEISLSLLALDLDLYSTIISFVPRFIIYNKLPFEVRVIHEHQPSHVVQSNGKCPLYYCYNSENALLFFQPTEVNSLKEEVWSYSSPISILFSTLMTVKVFSKDKKEKRLINIEKKLDMLSTYIILSLSSIDTAQMVIENHSENIAVRAYQSSTPEQGDFIPSMARTIFAWSNHLEDNAICFEFISKSLTICSVTRVYTLMDDMVLLQDQSQKKYPFTEFIKIHTAVYGGVIIKVIIKSTGCKNAISLWDYIESYSKEIVPRSIELELHVYIEQMGLSLIGDNKNVTKSDKEKYQRYEICYISFEEIVFYSKRIANSLTTNTDLQLIVRDIEIDNEIAYLKNFPIILLPSERRGQLKQRNTSFSSANQAGVVQPFFNLAIFMQKNHSEDFTRIPIFNYLIQAFTFNIESNVLVGLINFSKNITVDMKTSITSISPIFNSVKDNALKGVSIEDSFFMPDWIYKTNLSQKETLFIQQFSASSLEILLSFINQSKDKVFQHLLQSNRIVASLLSTISNIEKVLLKLNGCELNNFSGDWGDIIRNIVFIYQQHMLVQIMKLFGAIDILGNPLHLMNSLGKGFKDLFQKPAKGMMKGPLQGAIGLVDGTLSLAKHTIDSTLNSTSKITSGISKGMLLITRDDEYINDREKKKITERPKNVIEGIGYGLSSMAGGLIFGMADIVKKPIEGARKEKLKGFGKGVLKGLGGAIFKPISGVFDLVSKTTEGIKNTVAHEDNLQLKRIARPFYGKYKVIKEYNLSHAQIFELLFTKIDKVKHSSLDFYSCEVYHNSKEDSMLFAFFSNGIYTIDLLRKELKSILHYADIRDVALDDSNKIIITFKKEIDKRLYTSISLSQSASDPKKLIAKIKEAMEENYEENVI